jgi:heavy metal sensor kinase
VINPQALHVRLIVWHTFLLGCVMLGFGVYTYLSMESYLISSLEATLLRRARQIGSELTGLLPQNGDSQLILDIKRLYAPENNDRFIRITDQTGAVIYVSGAPKDQSFDPTTVPLLGGKPLQRVEGTINDNRIYIAATEVVTKGGKYIVEVGGADKQIKDALTGLMSTLALGFPVPLVLAAGGAYLLVRRSLSPVTDIMNAAENISLHNLSRRLPIAETGDKLEHLSRALNRMLTRLDDAFRQVSRFTADASHELRTPLTIMRGELESILRQPRLADGLREELSVVLEEVERLTHITEDLLVIARIEAGEVRIKQQVFDLGTLAASTAEQMQLLAEEKRIALNVNVEQPVVIEADAGHIKQVIVNLIDNAIKFTPEEGAIDVNVVGRDGQAVLSVCDTGIGIPAEHLPHIFERFYRAERTRSRTAGGAGLGLSILRSICLAHGGSVQVESVPNEGTCFTVNLPLAQTGT